MKSNIISTTANSISSGGTITGDLTISGDLTVEGNGSGTYDEIISGALVIDETGGTSNSAVLMLKADRASDGQDSAEIQFYNNHANYYAAIFGERGSADNYGDLVIKTRNSSGIGERIRIDEDGNVGIGAAPSTTLHLTNTANDATAPELRLQNTRAGGAGSDGDDAGAISFYAPDAGSNAEAMSTILSEVNLNTTGSTAGKLTFKTMHQNSSTALLTLSGWAGGSHASTVSSAVFNTSLVGIGTTTPDAKLELETDGDDQELRLSCHSDTEAHTNTLSFLKSDNTAASPATIDSGAVLGTIAYYGYDDNGYDTGAKIVVSADANWSSTERGTKIAFYTRDANESLSENLTINADGKIGIGGTPTTASLDIIRANDSAPHLSLQQSEGSGVTYNILSDDAGSFSIREGSDTRFKIDTSGTVILTKTTNETALEINNTGTGASIAIAGDDNVYISMDSTQSNGDEWRLQNAVSGTTSVFHLKNQDTDEYPIIATATGNIGIKAQPVSVHTDYSALQVGGQGLIMSNKTSGTDKSVYISNNAFPHSDGAGWDSIVADEGMLYEQHGGKHYFYISAATSSAGDALASGTALNSKFVIDVNSRISLSNNGGEATNTIFGYQAGNSIHASSGMNTFVGHQVADATMTADADENTAVGHLALSGLTSGEKNIAIGSYAGINITCGDENVLIGRSAGNNHNSSDLVAVGTAALASISDAAADGTVGVGHQALTALTSGAGNVAVGYNALSTETDAGFSTAIGHEALKTQESTYGSNTAVGYNASKLLTTGSNNVTIGAYAGDALTTSNGNIVIGKSAFSTAAIGQDYNIVIGGDAGTSINHADTQYNVIIGQDAGTGGTGAMTNCIAIGGNAMNSTAGNAADGIVAIGHDALTALTTGAENIAIGYQCMDAVDDGAENIAIGYQAMSGETSGAQSIAIGSEALKVANTTGAGTVGNIMIGHNSGIAITTGGRNTVIGAWSMQSNQTGYYNTGLGYNSLQIATGNSNTMVGYQAGDGITSGTNNTGIGESVAFDVDANNQTCVGSGATSASTGANTVVLGNANVTDVYIGHDGTTATARAGKALLQQTGIVTSGNYNGFEGNWAITGGDGDLNDTFVGIKSTMNFNDTGESFGNLYGIQNLVKSTETADEESTNIYGISTTAQLLGTHSDISRIYGNHVYVDISGGTVDNNCYGQYTEVDVDAGATAVTSLQYGHYTTCDFDTDPDGGNQVTMYYSAANTNVDYHAWWYDGVGATYAVRVSRAGQIDAEGTINPLTGLDYAEYFESKDGNKIAVGTTVKLDGDKITPCSDGDTPIGVIRPVGPSSVVGGGQAFHWQEKFMKDDYGATIWESYSLTKWTEEITSDEYNKRDRDEDGGVVGGIIKYKEVKGVYYKVHKYHSDRLPSGVTAPKDAITFSAGGDKRQKLNPNYNNSKNYKPREERDEWHIVGLLGQIQITKGQPTGSWIKMKDVSNTVEMYFVK